MRIETRKLLDKSFSGAGWISVFLMVAALAIILLPIAWRGAGAFVFRATVEHRRMMLELFGVGDPAEVSAETAAAAEARRPIYDMLARFRAELSAMPVADRRRMAGRLAQLENALRDLLGPLPGDPIPVLPRQRYGQTRWDRALKKLETVLFRETWDYSDPTRMGRKVMVPRAEDFKGTSLEPFFADVKMRVADMLRPKLAFYWRFLTDESRDSHFFGGIWPEMLGTIYLTIGAAMFAVPMGIISAVYLTEYAGDDRLTGALRTFIGALAGVPSIVFGLFGLAFFINTMKVSQSKSVLAGSLTLALLILPTIIRASEEAIRAVPAAYKEAALSLGAGKGRTIITVVLPAAMPGILTGIIISMGRAAGETAPIIFTAAVSVGDPLSLLETLSQPTPALPWNVYNMCTEHQKLDELRHVQFGMVLVLVMVVLALNVAAIWLRARISRKLKG